MSLSTDTVSKLLTEVTSPETSSIVSFIVKKDGVTLVAQTKNLGDQASVIACLSDVVIKMVENVDKISDEDTDESSMLASIAIRGYICKMMHEISTIYTVDDAIAFNGVGGRKGSPLTINFAKQEG